MANRDLICIENARLSVKVEIKLKNTPCCAGHNGINIQLVILGIFHFPIDIVLEALFLCNYFIGVLVGVFGISAINTYKC